MREYRPVGFSDADAAELAAIAREVDAAQAAVCAAQARLTRALARAEDLACRAGSRSSSGADMAHRAVATELAVPMRMSHRVLQHRMVDAAELATDYPTTVESWEAGDITSAHVRLIRLTGRLLPREKRSEFEQRALVWCEETTAGRVKSRVELLAERLHPRTLTERHRAAREERTVFVHSSGDGMCELTATLPLVIGDAIYDRLTRQATALQKHTTRAKARLRDAPAGKAAATDETMGGHRPDHAADSPPHVSDEILASDARTMDQLRADLLADMLLATQPSAGRGPLDPDTARRLAGGSHTGWDRILTDPIHGQVLATDRYQPTPDLRRRLRGRDAHCRFPGCRAPAIRNEHDHTVDFALGGRTTLENLAGLCQRHHSIKQFTAWTVTHLSAGVLAWTSPLRITYTDEPPVPSVFFIADDAEAHPPPF